MVNYKALRQEMLAHDCTAKELAKICNIGMSSFYRRIKGDVSFTLGEIYQCKARLDLSTAKVIQIFFV